MSFLDVLILIAKCLVLALAAATLFAYFTLFERILLARFQHRVGPNRAGYIPLPGGRRLLGGWLQPAADAVKLFFKEEVTPAMADKWVYLISPGIAVIPALIIWATIPLGCWPIGGDGTIPPGGCAPAGGTCQGRPCWKETGTGFKYRGRDVTPAGLRNSLQLVLKAGATGKAKIALTGKGGINPALPPLPLAEPATVQLVNDAGVCWEDTYSAPALLNDGATFKDKGD